ncbi:MAG: HepT-like ribonuclease domain-containing protein [Acidimicrobiales bacterium]
MSRRDEARLGDIAGAIEAIRSHLARGSLDDGLVYDAVRIRLLEIGEAVKGIDPELLGAEPSVPWKEIARMRDHLAHRYFDTDHAIVRDVVDHDLDPLAVAVEVLVERARRRGDGSDE